MFRFFQEPIGYDSAIDLQGWGFFLPTQTQLVNFDDTMELAGAIQKDTQLVIRSNEIQADRNNCIEIMGSAPAVAGKKYSPNPPERPTAIYSLEVPEFLSGQEGGPPFGRTLPGTWRPQPQGL